MARLCLGLGLTLALLTAAGCGRDLPLEVFLQDTWEGLELQGVQEAIDEWNTAAGSRLRDPRTVIDVAGRTDDEFDISDLGDSMHAIYRISEKTPEYQELEDAVGGMQGYGTYNDVLILTFMVFVPDPEAIPEAMAGDPTAHLRALALHELGHFIGVAHFNHEPGIMNSTEYPDPTITHLTDADLAAFCIAHDCRRTSKRPLLRGRFFCSRYLACYLNY